MKNELEGWQDYLEQPLPPYPAPDFRAEGRAVTAAWLAAAFSEESDTALGRYFRFHDRLISGLLATLAKEERHFTAALSAELRSLSGFLQTHFSGYLQAEPPRACGKLPLKCSVAQLGCLLRLLYDEGCFPASSVTELVRFSAAHFQTKKQAAIAAGGLSKEYYGTSQVTAAGCRGLLEKMIKKIDKQFFP
jgi:hypothetical protein